MQTSITDINAFKDELKANNLRFTHVRQAIFTALMETHSPLTIQEVIDQVPNGHFVSVYRSLEAMHEAGLVRQIPQGFKSLYELSDTFKAHHHHITCEECGRSEEIADPLLESRMNEITKKHGYISTKHQFELFGLCNDCQRKNYEKP